MATVGRYSIRLDQRNAGNTAYSEVFVSGSNLILTTDTNGNVTGSYIIPSSSYAVSASYAPTNTNITASWATNALTASSINFTASNSTLAATASSLIVNNSYTIVNLTSSGISSSGAIIASSFTGSFSGSIGNATSASYALSASYAPINTNITTSWATNSLTASSLNYQVATSSFATSSLTSSYLTSGTYNITSSWSTNSLTSSYITSSNIVGTVASASYALSASYITSSNIVGTVTSASYALSSSYAPTNTNITASWATNSLTASSLVAGNSYTITNLTVSNISSSKITASGILINGDLTVTGSIFASIFSASVIYITSSEVIIGDNIITLNALTPYKRYAGIEMYDSGSGTLSSLLWDSLNNYFFVSSSDVGASRQFILGPSGEANLTTNYIPLISGSNNLSSSVIYQSGSNIGIGTITPVNKLDVVGNISASVITASLFSGSFSGSHFGTSSWANNSLTASYITSSNIVGTVSSASYALTASYIANVSSNAISSPNSQTSITVNNNIISASVSGTQILTVVTQSNITTQNGSSSFQLTGRLSASNVNVGVPNDSYPWGTTPLTGSYFSTWNNDTNVSDILRFFAGAFSASYPIPTANTKTFSGVTGTNTNFGSTVTINGRIPSGSTNTNILYLQPLGWATIGSTVFSGFTFNTGAAYISYASTVGGSTTVSSSLGSSAFGLGLLNNGNLTQVNLSGSFRLTFASSSVGTINYTNTSASIILSQSATNLTPSIATPIALNTVPSANIAVIPPVYQDGYFSSFTGSNLTNSIALSNISSSGIYVFSASVGIGSGSSVYTSYTPSIVTYYYTPLTDASFTQTISSPNSSASYISAVTRSLSGAPYLTSGSSYRYVVTSSGAFNPLYVNGTVSSVTYTNATLGLTTANNSSLTTNPTIQTTGVVKSSDYVTTRAVGAYPFESDVIVFDLTINAAGTGNNVASSGASFSTFAVSTTTNNRAGSGTVVGSQTYNVHTAGSFGIPSASGSLLYFGRPEGFVTSSLTFGSQSLNPGAITEQLLDEANRIILADNMLNMSGSSFNSASALGTHELQVKPGFLANPGGSNGYWYPTGYGTTYKYYIRRFKSNLVVNKLQITLTGNTSLVNWDSTAANSAAMAIIFESADTNVYARCRLYDVNNLSNNVVSSSVASSDFSTSGVNPFGSNIDLYGNNGTGASNTSGIFIFPTRAADGAILDNTNAAQDELYLLIRYNGSPTPITSIKIEKLS